MRMRKNSVRCGSLSRFSLIELSTIQLTTAYTIPAIIDRAWKQMHTLGVSVPVNGRLCHSGFSVKRRSMDPHKTRTRMIKFLCAGEHHHERGLPTITTNAIRNATTAKASFMYPLDARLLFLLSLIVIVIK